MNHGAVKFNRSLQIYHMSRAINDNFFGIGKSFFQIVGDFVCNSGFHNGYIFFREIILLFKLDTACRLVASDAPFFNFGFEIIFAAHGRIINPTEHRDLPDVR